jgi:hypothetical protein
MGENPDLRNQHGRTAITEQFTPATMVDTIEKVYNGLMSAI